MAETSSLRCSFLILLCLVALITPGHAEEARQVYIVYMGRVDDTYRTTSDDHVNMLQEVVDTSFVKQSLVRSYTRSFRGFAANLTAQEYKKIASLGGVKLTFPSRTYELQTTGSWDFVGLTKYVKRKPAVESDIIIGVLDSGIWNNSESFSDEGFSPPPKKWKGACKGGNGFTCNNKVIGARFYGINSFINGSVVDVAGHGSHTASIAAGNPVKDASFYGIAKGTARGAVPSARIAAYSVCPDKKCRSEDILSGFDDAIADGVDIITISIGASAPNPDLTDDSVSIGSLHAAFKDILVIKSAGNSGNRKTVDGVAPWVFTVAASTTNRKIVSKVVLGNGTTLLGKGVNAFQLKGTTFPLAYGKNISTQCTDDSARHCEMPCLEENLVKGKIVLCEGSDLSAALASRPIGTIVPTNQDTSHVLPLPASALTKEQLAVVQEYFSSTSNPTVDILTSESVLDCDAPRVAGFSSKGPNSVVPDILKPDITAPGVEILAAYSPMGSPSGFTADQRSVNYNVLSGTSMACPHVAGAAAYVKSFHPGWSASAIKSALMTTARRMSASKDPDAEFAYGAGQIDPVRAADPGLVYETPLKDYVKLLCGLGYQTWLVEMMFDVKCPKKGNMPPKDLNYPSMTFRVNANATNTSSNFSVSFTRRVRNVGDANSTYKAITSQGSRYNITVNPNTLTFQSKGEKKSFEVIISGQIGNQETISASLEWSDGARYDVYSPIVVYQDNVK